MRNNIKQDSLSMLSIHSQDIFWLEMKKACILSFFVDEHSCETTPQLKSELWISVWRLKNYFYYFLLLSFPERNQLALVIKLLKCRLTSLVYRLAFHLELLFEESVAILLLGLQAPVKKVKTKRVACSNPTSEFQG